MSVPKWRRSESRLDAFYEAVKLWHIVTQIIMRSYRLKTNFKSLIPDRFRKEYPDLAKLFEKIDRYQETVEKTKHYLYRWKKSTVKAYKKFLEEKEGKQ